MVCSFHILMSYLPKTSDGAVKKATGKTWKEWFTILDIAGAKTMPHIEIARLLYKKYLRGPDAQKGRSSDKHRDISPDVAKSGGWWSQMVTVEYERARGLRAVNQTATGFSVSVHGTFPVPVSKLFAAWRKIADRQGLREGKIKKHATNGSIVIRYIADRGKPRYVAMFVAKTESTSRIGFEAMRLPKKSGVEKQRKKWKRALGELHRVFH
jgi:hypothetical protein